MKFIISNSKSLKNKFGDWFYYHDNRCKILEHDGKLSLYHGYIIDGSKKIEEAIVDGSISKLLNGNFFVITMTHKTVRVTVDYFSQHKIFYRHKENVMELTNKIYLLPLTYADIDYKSMHKKVNHATYENYTKLSHTENPVEKYMQRRGKSGSDLYEPVIDNPEYVQSNNQVSIFKDVNILPPYHILDYDGKCSIRKVIDLKSEIHKSLFDRTKESVHKDSVWLEEKIYQCMLDHSDIIKKNYRKIVSSVSEGIDSVLQDSFFPEAKKITYIYDPPATTEKYKQDYLNRFDHDNVEWHKFDLNELPKITERFANDPYADHFDTLPTAWQVSTYHPNVDAVLYGQIADQIFLHRPYYLYLYLVGTLYDDHSMTLAEKYEHYQTRIKDFDHCYSNRETIDGPAFHLYNKSFDMTDTETFRHNMKKLGGDWKNKFVEQVVPSTYSRDLMHSCDVPMISLYADTRIFHLIHQSSNQILIDNMSDARTQRNIVEKKFGYKFITPGKDGAWFNMHDLIKPWYKHTINYCLKDHLSEAM